MLSHQLLASIIPGTAFCLLVVSIFNHRFETANGVKLFRLVLSIFIIQFAIALISGLSLETGLSYYWPQLKGSLYYLVHYPFGRSALIAFFLIGGLAFYLLKFNKHSSIRTLACLTLFLSSFFLSLWSVIINCLMQDPSALAFEIVNNSFEINAIDFSAIITNSYFKFRILHIYQSSFLQGISLVLLILFFLIAKNSLKLDSYLKTIILSLSLFLVVLLVTQPLLGHLQFEKLTEIQPTKAAAFEGYFDKEDGFQMYIIGKTNSKTQTTIGLSAPNFIKQQLISNHLNIQPLNQIDKDKWPPIERVFNAFHIMILSWIFIVFLCLILILNYLKNRSISMFFVQLMFIAFVLTIIGSLAGWTASETGRQPWVFWGVIKTADSYVPVQNYFSYWTILFGNVILPILLLFVGILFHIRLISNFVKQEILNANNKVSV